MGKLTDSLLADASVRVLPLAPEYSDFVKGLKAASEEEIVALAAACLTTLVDREAIEMKSAAPLLKGLADALGRD